MLIEVVSTYTGNELQ